MASITHAFSVLELCGDTWTQLFKERRIYTGSEKIRYACSCGNQLFADEQTITILQAGFADMVTNIFTGSTDTIKKCRHMNCNKRMWKVKTRESLLEFAIGLEGVRFWRKTKIEELQSIPLITDELEEYQYYFRSFITLQYNHFTLWLLDWRNRRLIECQTRPAQFIQHGFRKFDECKTDIAFVFLRIQSEDSVIQHTQNNIQQRMFLPTQTIKLTVENMMTFSRATLGQMMELRPIWRGMFKKRCAPLTTECDNRIRQILTGYVQFGHEETFFNRTEMVHWEVFQDEMDVYLPHLELHEDISEDNEDFLTIN